MDRAVIYARYSSDNQREESIDAQVRACREYCKRKDYFVTHIYKDEAKSGTKLAGRDAYKQMLADVKENLFDVIIFHKIDRNARNELDYYLTKDMLEKNNVRYEYAVQNIDGSPEGQMMENMLVGFAAYYSRNLSKETKKGLNENAHKCLFNGGVPPLGYDIDQNQRYVINTKEAEIVKLIFKLYIEGIGYKKIAEKLDELGYKTKTGGDFGKNSLFDIIGNEKYCGIYSYNKHPRAKNGKGRNMHAKSFPEDYITIDNAIPAIISMELYEAAQARRRQNKSRPGIYNGKRQYLLTGKIFCGHCGSAMGGHTITPRKKSYSYYGCLDKDRTPAHKCTQKQINTEIVDTAVINKIKHTFLNSEALLRIADKMRQQYATLKDDVEDEIHAKTSQMTGAIKRRNNLYCLVEQGINDDYTLGRISAVNAEVEKLKVQIDNLKDKKNLKVLTDEAIIKAFKLFESKICSLDTNSAKKLLVELFLIKVIVTDKNIDIILDADKITNMVMGQ